MAEILNFEKALAHGAKRFYYAPRGGVWKEEYVVTLPELKDPWGDEELKHCIFMPILTPMQMLCEFECNVIDISHFPHVECPVGIPLSEDMVKEGDRVIVRTIEKDSENTRFSFPTSSEPVPDPFGQEAIRKLARENADLLAQIAELQANQKPIQ
jgi:hypothetical protein